MKIALIAHDKKKDAMIQLAIRFREALAPHELYATGTTGTLVMGETGLKITRMKSGPLGGDQQIGSMIADGQLDVAFENEAEIVFNRVIERILREQVNPVGIRLVGNDAVLVRLLGLDEAD